MLADQTRIGTLGEQANWRVTVEGKSSVNKLAGVFPSQSTTVQEDGVTSSTDAAEPATDSTEIYKTANESVSVDQGQLLQAVEPDQGVLKVKTQRQIVILEFTHSLQSSWCTACVYGKAADDPHRRRQDSDLEDASFERTDIAAVTEPNDVTEYMVRVSCDRSDEWRFGVCCLKCQNETAEITLQNTVDTTRRVKTIPRKTTRYSHDSLGHCESNIKEMEKQIRVLIFHTSRADHECDRDRRAPWTFTQCTVNAEEQTSFFKWMSKDDHGKVAKFVEWSWLMECCQAVNTGRTVE